MVTTPSSGAGLPAVLRERERCLREALQACAGRRFDEARELGRAILDLVPNDLQARTLLAIVEDAAGNPEGCRDRLGEVLAQDPDYPEALYYAGVVAGREQHPHEAMTLLRRAIAHQSPEARRELAEYHASLGSALWMAKQYDEALAAWHAALGYDREHPRAQGYIAQHETAYGFPRTGAPELDEFHAFQRVMKDEYLRQQGRKQFSTLQEATDVSNRILQAWPLVAAGLQFASLSPEEKLERFRQFRI